MRRRLLAAALGLVALAAAPAAAGPYRWIDERGNIHYSDRPPQDRASQDMARPHAAAPARPAAAGEPAGPGEPEAGALPDSGEALAREVMKLSGLEHALASVTERMRAELTMRGGSTQAREAAPAVARAFAPEVLRAAVARALAERLEGDHPATVLAWLRSPLGRQVTETEKAVGEVIRGGGLAAFVDRLPAAPPAPPRLALVQRLERAVQSTDLRREVDETLAQATAALLGRRAAREAAPDDGADEGDAEEATRFFVLTTMLLAYQGLTESELQAYVRHAESPAGRWLWQARREALLDALRAAGQAATAALGGRVAGAPPRPR